jgi:L-ascorbate metabolism protein UlaG (beta-lactamase superfamily)
MLPSRYVAGGVRRWRCVVGGHVGQSAAPQSPRQFNEQRGSQVKIRFLGHACFELVDDGTTVLIDPFLTDNPKAAASADDVNPTHIVITHGHFDHYGDAVSIAKRTGAQCIAITELTYELQGAGVEDVVGPNLGGTAPLGDGWVRFVPAWHTSTTPGGLVNTPAGVVIRMGSKTVYHLGDTALFSDLSLVAARDHIDVALMCIGGFYTMDRHDAVSAAKFVAADCVIPCHYGTFPGIDADDRAFKADVESETSSRVVILDPGSEHSVV